MAQCRANQQKKVKKQDRTKNGRARSEEAKKQHTHEAVRDLQDLHSSWTGIPSKC